LVLILLLQSLGSSKLVIIGGLAELFSGAISMGLGAYLAAVTERDHYLSEEKRERDEVATRPEDEREEIFEIMEDYGIGRDAARPLVEKLQRDPEQWIRVIYLSPIRSSSYLTASIVHDGLRIEA
jgi:VIT1/CCC1 family predicted Fe2+/Mn2+ transporter